VPSLLAPTTHLMVLCLSMEELLPASKPGLLNSEQSSGLLLLLL
jgi:hypothetical protein